ncbi:MAG: hypothetical protein NUV32_00580 [Exilispira sp.]|jgi:hypothetical protein|nr:hypothetical protein [Exilispira sp.]
MDQKKIDYDEISLVDILKIIWKYRWFIVGFCIIGVLISFGILFYNEKNKMINYSYEINLPSISFVLYSSLKLNIQYDKDKGNLNKILNINEGLEDVKFKYYIKDISSNENNYNFNENNFPTAILGIEISFENEIDEKSISKFKSYLQNILFYNLCKSDIDGIKEIFLESKENIIQSIDKSQSEVFIFIAKLSEKLYSIYYLENFDDVDYIYNQIKEFLKDINISNKLTNEARDLFVAMINNNYQLIKNDSTISKENYIKNEINLKSIIKKLIIITIGIAFISILMVFVIDFFKKNWKEIVKEK